MKFIHFSFAILLGVWFTVSMYLSFIYVLDLFFDTNPYIAKNISAFSFLFLAILGVYNKYSGGNLTKIAKSLQNINSERSSGCKTCGNKKTKI